MLAAIVIGMVVAALCTLARWYLERSSLGSPAARDSRAVLQPLYNEGAGFGCRWLRGGWLLAGSVAALALLLAEAGRRQNFAGRLGVGAALGGGVSNLWERVRHGRVFDYIRFPKAPGRLGRLVFNLADFAILLGAGCLLLSRLLHKK